MFDTSIIELSRSALRRNVRYLQNRIGPEVRLTSVVKGNAYGHGIGHFIPLAESCGLRSFAVFGADEAAEVVAARKSRSDVLIMGWLPDEALEWAIENGVAFFVFDLDRLRASAEAARRVGRPARVHLEVETGLNRTGLDADELRAAVAVLRGNADALAFEGLCTHYAGAESSANYLRIQSQVELFHEHAAYLRGEGARPVFHHTACSAAALTMPETRMDMVRIGISLYGYWPSKEIEMRVTLENEGAENGRRRRDPLARVIRWRSRVMTLNTVGPGKFVGYGTHYMTTRRQRFALVPVGYSHGFTRALTNLGHVLVRGRRAPVAGVVNMSLMIVDVTDVRGVEAGDEVVLIGKQRSAQISVGSFSDLSRYLNYEALVRLPSSIPRVVVD